MYKQKITRINIQSEDIGRSWELNVPRHQFQPNTKIDEFIAYFMFKRQLCTKTAACATHQQCMLENYQFLRLAYTGS